MVWKSTSSAVLIFSGMDFEDCFPSRQVGELHRHAAVKAAGTGERRVERFRPVGRGQDDDAVIVLEPIHFGQKLVQGLLAFIVAAASG